MSGVKQILRSLAYGITCIEKGEVNFPAIAKAWRDGLKPSNAQIEIVLEKLSKIAPLRHGHYSRIASAIGESSVDIWQKQIVDHYWLGSLGTELKEHTHNWGVLRKPANVMPQHLTLDWVQTGQIAGSFETDGREIFLVNILPVVSENDKMMIGKPTQVRSLDELSIDKVSVGDWIVTHHGLIVEKIGKEAAQQASEYNKAILALWNERG